jgi:hypothetical protein
MREFTFYMANGRGGGPVEALVCVDNAAAARKIAAGWLAREPDLLNVAVHEAGELQFIVERRAAVQTPPAGPRLQSLGGLRR